MGKESSIELQILQALENHHHKFQNRYWYTIRLSFPLTKGDCERYSAKDLNGIVRQLINGKRSLGKVNNRDWFTRNFLGGFYKTIINQATPEAYPITTYLLQCYSDRPNLNSEIEKSLNTRFKQIVPTGTATIGAGRKIDITDRTVLLSDLFSITYCQTAVSLGSDPVKALGQGFRLFCINALKEEIRAFGELYKAIYPSFWQHR